MSAHAFREDYRQRCKECNTWRFAKYMWENYERHVIDSSEPRSKRPHRADLCQACLNGDFCVENDNK